MHADTAASGDVERAVRAGSGTAGTFDQRRGPPRNSHGAQQICVEYQLARPIVVSHCPQRSDGEPMQRGDRSTLLTSQPLRGLQDGASAGIAAVVTDDVRRERVDGLHLGDDVEVSTRMQLNVDVRKRLQPCPELTARAAHTLGDRTYQTVLASQEGDDPVGLTELVLTQHHCSIPVQPHRSSLSSTTDDIAEARPTFPADILDFDMVDTRLPTLAEQSYRLANGTVTSADLVNCSLEAIVESQPTLNAFRVVLETSARAEAVAADRRLAAGEHLPLLGIPIAVKDDVDVAGVPTRFGTSGEIPPAAADAEVVRRLREAGAVIVGKTNTCELGQWPFTSGPGFGHTRNPWSKEHSPGGSSGGSAAAVAAGLVTAAIGSDGAGSVRIPAAWTHLVGIKPQRGRISTWPLPEAFNGITVNGVLARTVTDAALVLDAASGNVDGDLHKPPPIRVAEYVGRAPGPLTIAFSTKFPFNFFRAKLHPEILTAMEAVATQLESVGHTIIETNPDYGLRMSWNFLSRSTSGLLDWGDRLGRFVELDKRTVSNMRTGRLLSEAVLRKARSAEAATQRRIGWIFNLADVVLAPTTALPPTPLHDYDRRGSLSTDRAMIRACHVTWPWNVLGWPSINVPAGFTSEGLPIGVQLMGPENSEPLLVSLAAELEAIGDWANKQPEPWWENSGE